MEKLKKRFEKEFLLFYFGLGLFFIFLSLWFITLPTTQSDKDTIIKPFEEMNLEEQIDFIKKETANTIDQSNYLRATNNDNNYYCERIENRELKEKCFEEITNYEELVVDTRSETEILDDSNYRRAINSGNEIYCTRIKDETKKETCFSELNK